MSKIHEFQVQIQTTQPTLILITETWLNADIPDTVLALPDYEIFRGDRHQMRGGGVCIMVKNEINGQKIYSNINVNYQNPQAIDMIWVNLRICSKTMLIGCVYRPPHVGTHENLAMVESLSKAFTENPETVVMGDFNYPEIDWSALVLKSHNVCAGDFLRSYQEWNCWQIVTEDTRMRGEQSSLLDLLLVSDKKLVSEVKYLPPIGKSDHCVILSALQLQLERPTKKILKRNYWGANYEVVNQHIQGELERMESTVCYGELERVTNETIDLYIPLRPQRVNSKKPWISVILFKEIDKKRSLWDKYKKNKTKDNYDQYRQHNNQLKTKILQAKKHYEEDILERGDKHFYAFIKRSLNSRITHLVLRDKYNDIVTEGTQVAKILAEQFQQMYTREPDTDLPALPNETRNCCEITNIEITDDKVYEALMSLKKDSSPGPDGISSVFLINCARTLAPYLAQVFSILLQNGEVPDSWKEAYVIPIYKKGDRTDPANYRPISLTSHLCKVLEKIITKEISNFLILHKIIPPDQHGFLAKRSTTTNLLKCVNHWTKEIDERQPVDVLYLDYEKAFDKVPLKRLLLKLDHYGIRGSVLLWIKDFLIDRTYKVRVNGECSQSLGVFSGVPQGSVLGPLLFIAYISDLSALIRTNISLFADDTKLYCNPLKDKDSFLRDIEVLEEWADTWLMKLNKEKCYILHLGANNPHYTYELKGLELKAVNQHKDLGLIVSSDLKWATHIAQTVKRANSLIYLVQRAFSNTSVDMISKIYKSFIRPKLEYAHSIYCPYYVGDIELMERVQRRVTRMPLELRGVAYEERLEKFRLPTLRQRRLRGDLIETYKILSSGYSEEINLSSMYQHNTNEHLRGHSKKLSKEKCATLVRKNFLTNRVVYQWNALDEETISAPNINIFKNRLDQNLKDINIHLVHYL